MSEEKVPEWAKSPLKKYADLYNRPIEEMTKVYAKLRKIGYSPIAAVGEIPKSLWSGTYEKYAKNPTTRKNEEKLPVCNLNLLKLNVRSLAVRAAIAEVMDHACYVHKFKTACDSIVEARESVDEMSDAVIRELKDCLEAKK